MSWKLINLSIVFASLVAGPMIAASFDFGEQRPTFNFILIITLFVCFSVLFLCGFDEKLSRGRHVWQAPSLSKPILFFGQPLQMFQIGAYVFLAMGVGAFIHSFVQSLNSWVWVLFLSVGVGALIGVFLSTKAFKKNIEAR